MYEEKKFVNKKISWSSVFLKLLLVVLVLLLVWYIFYNKKNDVKKPKKGNDINDNLKYFKDNAVKYFIDDRLPINTNSKVKVSLDEIIKDGKIDSIYDKNGEECSIYSSYAQVTKIDDENYTLKVYLKCKNEADSILTNIKKEKKDNNKVDNKDTKNTDNKKDNDNSTNKNSNTTTKDNDSKSSSSSSKSSSSSSSSSKSSSSSSSKSSSSSSSSSKSSTSTSSSSSSSSSSTTTTSTTTTTTTTTTTPIADNTPSKVVDYVLYQHAKYGEWTTTKPDTGNYQVSSLPVVYNRYCPAPDYENCHLIAAADKQNVNFYVMQGFVEVYDHTEYKTIYRTADCIWSKEQHVDGYEFTGVSKTIYKAA